MKKQFNEEVSSEIRPIGGYTEIYRTLFGDRNKKDNYKMKNERNK